MNPQTILVELLLSGFFAVACLRASDRPIGAARPDWSNLFRFPGRIERLRRARWQWIGMVSVMIVLRLQGELPFAAELMAALQLLLFLALPTRTAPRRAEGRGDAPAV